MADVVKVHAGEPVEERRDELLACTGTVVERRIGRNGKSPLRLVAALPCNAAMTNLGDWADPDMRASIELLFGPEPTPVGVVRGRTVRGPSKPSADQAIRAATRDLVHRLASELETFATRRPRCEYVMAPYIPTCPDPRCQAWFDEVIAWHAERFGARHATVSVMAAWALSEGRGLPISIDDGPESDPFRPGTVALDIVMSGDWTTAQLGVHGTASRADLHALVDRMRPEIERLRALSRPRSVPAGRLGVVDRPARTSYWRIRRHQGMTLVAIASEWEDMTHDWAANRAKPVPIHQLEYPAHREWRRRGANASVEAIAEVGTIGRAIAKLNRLTSTVEERYKPRTERPSET
jgi:hypothetical protein